MSSDGIEGIHSLERLVAQNPDEFRTDEGLRHLAAVAGYNLADPDQRLTVREVAELLARNPSLVHFLGSLTVEAADSDNALVAALEEGGRDGSTGLLNRTGLNRFMMGCFGVSILEGVASPGRRGTPDQIAQTTRAGVIFGDLDELKLVNDTIGHSAGDTLILDAARHLNQQVRLDGSTALSRYGGDEFVIVTAGQTMKEVYQLYARLKDIEDQKQSGLVTVKLSLGWAYSEIVTADNFKAMVDWAKRGSHRHKAAKLDLGIIRQMR